METSQFGKEQQSTHQEGEKKIESLLLQLKSVGEGLEEEDWILYEIENINELNSNIEKIKNFIDNISIFYNENCNDKNSLKDVNTSIKKVRTKLRNRFEEIQKNKEEN